MRNRTRKEKAGRRGAALFMALGLLAVFSVLGAAWLKYMMIEADAADYRLLQTRAGLAAEGGARAGIGAVLRARAAGDPAKAAGEREYPFNTYGPVRGAAPDPAAVLTDRFARAKVTITPVSDPALLPPLAAEAAGAADGLVFRITSAAVAGRTAKGVEYGRCHAGVDTVVRLLPDGGHEIVWWNGTAPPGDAR